MQNKKAKLVKVHIRVSFFSLYNTWVITASVWRILCKAKALTTLTPCELSNTVGMKYKIIILPKLTDYKTISSEINKTEFIH